MGRVLPRRSTRAGWKISILVAMDMSVVSDNNTRIDTRLGQGPRPKEIRSMLRFDI